MSASWQSFCVSIVFSINYKKGKVDEQIFTLSQRVKSGIQKFNGDTFGYGWLEIMGLPILILLINLYKYIFLPIEVVTEYNYSISLSHMLTVSWKRPCEKFK